ncbi:MAG: hypothetical protein IKZ61_11860 [Prevotella sp.]|nr:hypothetical protein [Prevotella sp.]
MGLSYADFCRCTPEEFECICQAYHAQREAEWRDGWERTRALVVATLRPHLKGKPSALQVYPLPWDKEKTLQKKENKPVSKSEAFARFEGLMKRVRS